ncbi:N-acetyltransferase [Kribbella antibiotica]|uniref:N-acetyltransferase n=1 Tax=Kribbella antibiotica TaxID=190195 RepID=A0A4R4ZIN1_9ACTN|nr:N-acetyltransferase [Kribbella antibiotica]TDD57379.1 N-acetyltransferase [Kribbella antibiotica]
MTSFRVARPDDAQQIALLHADSWRLHYRGAFADAFLDGDIEPERHATWAERLAVPAHTETILAEEDDQLVGFVHVMLDADPQWGSFVDNLHVRNARRGSGIGGQLLRQAASAVQRRAASNAMYLWVLEQNIAAQGFYRAKGGEAVGTGHAAPPGGDPSRLNGRPVTLRIAWADVATLG